MSTGGKVDCDLTIDIDSLYDHTGEYKTREVSEPRILLENLYPGAGYQIKVFAVSHGLWSEPHTHFQAVCKPLLTGVFVHSSLVAFVSPSSVLPSVCKRRAGKKGLLTLNLLCLSFSLSSPLG